VRRHLKVRWRCRGSAVDSAQFLRNGNGHLIHLLLLLCGGLQLIDLCVPKAPAREGWDGGGGGREGGREGEREREREREFLSTHTHASASVDTARSRINTQTLIRNMFILHFEHNCIC
jgi:hypothetical protein